SRPQGVSLAARAASRTHPQPGIERRATTQRQALVVVRLLTFSTASATKSGISRSALSGSEAAEALACAGPRYQRGCGAVVPFHQAWDVQMQWRTLLHQPPSVDDGPVHRLRL